MNDTSYRSTLIRRSYSFSVAIIIATKNISWKDHSSQILVKQLIRSATSIGANIVEAQASPTRKDFTHFINYALKSANETRYWIALLRDTMEQNIPNIDKLLKEAQELAKILGSTVKSSRSKIS